jgi:hypothetical protein
MAEGNMTMDALEETALRCSCRILEHQLKVAQETNRRLNRRCQLAEAAAADAFLDTGPVDEQWMRETWGFTDTTELHDGTFAYLWLPLGNEHGRVWLEYGKRNGVFRLVADGGALWFDERHGFPMNRGQFTALMFGLGIQPSPAAESRG